MSIKAIPGLLVVAVTLVGCGHAPILKDLSAGHTECSKREVVLFDHEAREGVDTWVAECRGEFYDCKAEGFDTVEAHCEPIPDSEVTPRMRAEAQEEHDRRRRTSGRP